MKTQIVEDNNGRRIVNPTARTISGGTTDAKEDQWTHVVTEYSKLSNDELTEVSRKLRLQCGENAHNAVRHGSAAVQE